MTTRRSFLKNIAWASTALSTTSILACTNKPKPITNQVIEKELKISLAQWSLNRAFFAKKIDPIDFANIAIKEYAIKAIEFVSQFYIDHAKEDSFWIAMKERSYNVDVENLLIMVDDEGDLGNTNDAKRKTAVENHYKWVHAAKLSGCHSIRVNAFGEGTKEAVRTALIDGMGQLATYAAKENINIIIENHGLFSSDGKFITSIMKEVNMPNFGTLPDFGNWCTNAKWGSTQKNKCDEVYDRYQGVKDFLPYAKGVSAKSYNFNKKGEDTIIDYQKMLKIVKDSDYDGYIGIEYEGEDLGESEGIRITKALMEKVWKNL